MFNNDGTVNLDLAEEFACTGQSVDKQLIARLVSQVRSLQHQLNDPNYLYAGGRIHRQALISREMEANLLRDKYEKAVKGRANQDD